jgi:hypothetical protein
MINISHANERYELGLEWKLDLFYFLLHAPRGLTFHFNITHTLQCLLLTLIILDSCCFVDMFMFYKKILLQ